MCETGIRTLGGRLSVFEVYIYIRNYIYLYIYMYIYIC